MRNSIVCGSASSITSANRETKALPSITPLTTLHILTCTYTSLKLKKINHYFFIKKGNRIDLAVISNTRKY